MKLNLRSTGTSGVGLVGGPAIFGIPDKHRPFNLNLPALVKQQQLIVDRLHYLDLEKNK